MSLRAALIDMGGTLGSARFVPTRQPELTFLERVASEGLPLNGEQARQVLRDFSELWSGPENLADLRQDTLGELRRLCGRLNIRVDGNQMDQLRRALCIPPEPGWLFPGATELLESIRRLGLRSVVLTNAGPNKAADIESMLDELGLSKLIDEIISSADVGYRKPSPVIFNAAIAAGRAVPPDVVMIGDNEVNDIAPAKAIGCRAIRVAIDRAPTHTVADATVTSHWAVPGCLRSLLSV